MDVAKQTVVINVGSGSWRLIVDGDNINATVFEGSTSVPVGLKFECRRIDVPNSTEDVQKDGGPG